MFGFIKKLFGLPTVEEKQTAQMPYKIETPVAPVAPVAPATEVKPVATKKKPTKTAGEKKPAVKTKIARSKKSK
jgi:hypothetical protein